MLQSATIIFMNNVRFDTCLNTEIIRNFRTHVKDMTRVITLEVFFLFFIVRLAYFYLRNYSPDVTY